MLVNNIQKKKIKGRGKRKQDRSDYGHQNLTTNSAATVALAPFIPPSHSITRARTTVRGSCRREYSGGEQKKYQRTHERRATSTKYCHPFCSSNIFIMWYINFPSCWNFKPARHRLGRRKPLSPCSVHAGLFRYTPPSRGEARLKQSGKSWVAAKGGHE